MPALTTVLGFAALASTFVRAAPIEARGAPKTWAYGYLEDYDAYHLRYLALGCQNKHNTTFFEDCCHPLLATQSLSDRPAYCTPNATEIAAASSYIASTSMYGPPTATATGAATTTCITDDSTETPADTPAAAATTTTTKAAVTTDTPKVAAAEPTTTKTTSTTPAYVAPTTTSTTPAYVAPTTQAAATTTKASSGGGSGTMTGGYATYFYQGGQAGACGVYHSDSDYIIAIDSAWWPDFGSTSQYCGRWITIQNTNNGKTVTAQVADVCPTCVNGNSLDLSVGAFTAIASTGDGMVPINWWWA